MCHATLRVPAEQEEAKLLSGGGVFASLPPPCRRVFWYNSAITTTLTLGQTSHPEARSPNAAVFLELSPFF